MRRSEAGAFEPGQLAEHLGLVRWQVDRAVRLGLIKSPDIEEGRWSAAAAAEAGAHLERIRAGVGTMPDCGAVKAAALLKARFPATEVTADAVVELCRRGLVPEVGDYKGYPLYCGRTLEVFDDEAALRKAIIEGVLRTTGESATYLRIRPADFAHLVRAKWIEPRTWGYGPFQSRHAVPKVPLYRTGDLDILAAHPAIDWEAVRATPPGRPSPLAVLTARCPQPRRESGPACPLS